MESVDWTVSGDDLLSQKNMPSLLHSNSLGTNSDDSLSISPIPQGFTLDKGSPLFGHILHRARAFPLGLSTRDRLLTRIFLVQEVGR